MIKLYITLIVLLAACGDNTMPAPGPDSPIGVDAVIVDAPGVDAAGVDATVYPSCAVACAGEVVSCPLSPFICGCPTPSGGVLRCDKP